MVLVIFVHSRESVGEEVHGLFDLGTLHKFLVLNFRNFRVHLIIIYYLSAVNQ